MSAANRDCPECASLQDRLDDLLARIQEHRARCVIFSGPVDVSAWANVLVHNEREESVELEW